MRPCSVTGILHDVTHRHHIHSKGSGGSDDGSNMIRLCPVHHGQAHQGYLVLDDCSTSRGEAFRTIEGRHALDAWLLERTAAAVRRRAADRDLFTLLFGEDYGHEESPA